MTKRQGVFCLESDWSRNLADPLTVEPVLQLLHAAGVAKYIRRDCGTKGEFEYYVKQWRRYPSYPVLYVAAHGSKNAVNMGFQKRGEVSLDDMSGWLTRSCHDRVIYFGSCSVLSTKPGVLKAFVKATGARAVIGYRKDINWLDSAAFECMLLSALLRGQRTDAFFNHMHNRHGPIAKELGLVAATANNVYK